MKLEELNLKPDGFFLSTKSYKRATHDVVVLLSCGRALPSCKSQLKTWNYLNIAVLNYDDCRNLESIFNKAGKSGSFRYTKSKKWCRLNNYLELKDVLSKEFKA